MANKKISELPAATALDGTELIPVVQAGVTSKVDFDTALLDRGVKEVQQYFRYVYDNSVLTESDPGKGGIRFNNLVVADATEMYIDNLTADVVDTGIGAFILDQPQGTFLHIQAVDSSGFCIIKIGAVTSHNSYKKVLISDVVNSITFTDGAEVKIQFIGQGNMIYDPTTANISVNGASVGGYSIAANFAALPAATGFTEPEVYWVTDPGIWMQCDTVLDVWVPLNNIGRLYRNLTPFKTTAPNTQAASIADNGSGKVRITANTHLLTANQNDYEVYISSWTAGNGVAGRYRITYVSANTYDLPDLNYAVGLGTPVVALGNGTDDILLTNVPLPPLSPKGVVRVKQAMKAVDDSAEDRIFRVNFEDAGGGNSVNMFSRTTTTAGDDGEYNDLAFRNLGVTNSQATLTANNQTGAPATVTAVYSTATKQSNVATNLRLYMRLNNAASGVCHRVQHDDLCVWLEG